MGLQRGWVNFYSPHQKRGFIVTEDGREISFNAADERLLLSRNGYPVWSDSAPARASVLSYREALLFEVAQGSQARHWTTRAAYFRQLNGEPPIFRLVLQFYYQGVKEEPQVVWRGTDLDCPRLAAFWAPEVDSPEYASNLFSFAMWFERQEGKRWTKCADPRI
ncbi:MAG: hypothetical protein ABIB61_01795 [Candidatus Shapirobacteria bacterium]